MHATRLILERLDEICRACDLGRYGSGGTRLSDRQIDVSDIPALLHDATLSAIECDASLRTARMTLYCLRRSPDGSDIPDRTVELQLLMVERIAAYYDAASFEQRFSELAPPEFLSLDNLRQLKFQNIECNVTINSLDELFNLRSSAHVDWLLGDPIDSLNTRRHSRMMLPGRLKP